MLLPAGAHFVAGLDILRVAVDCDRNDQHHREDAEQRAVGAFRTRAVGERFESADDEAGKRLHAGDTEHHGGVDRRHAAPEGKLPLPRTSLEDFSSTDNCEITVDDLEGALKKQNLTLQPGDAGVGEFAFVMQPLKIQGGSGSTVSPIAVR